MPVTSIPEVIGMPPSTYISNNLRQASMPIAEFTPSTPEFEEGITLFKLSKSEDKFREILNKYGFDCNLPLKIAFTAENFPSDQFTNEYGQNFLSKIGDVASGALRDITQISGGQSASDLLGEMTQAFKKSGIPGSEAIGGAAQQLGKKGKGALSAGLTELPGVNADAAGKMVDRMLSGARIDFPQTWQNSGYETSYSLTVKLYNPSPGSLEATRRFIIGPLAAILLLGLPRSKGLGTFQWPFFHKVKCRGLFNLSPGVITNISVIKGGDQQQIAHNQRPGLVDVRIELASLYSSLIANEEGDNISSRPTLKDYLQSMENEKTVVNAYTATGSAEDPMANVAMARGAPPTVGTAETEETGPRVAPDTINKANALA